MPQFIVSEQKWTLGYVFVPEFFLVLHYFLRIELIVYKHERGIECPYWPFILLFALLHSEAESEVYTSWILWSAASAHFPLAGRLTCKHLEESPRTILHLLSSKLLFLLVRRVRFSLAGYLDFSVHCISLWANFFAISSFISICLAELLPASLKKRWV